MIQHKTWRYKNPKNWRFAEKQDKFDAINKSIYIPEVSKGFRWKRGRQSDYALFIQEPIQKTINEQMFW